MPHIATDESIAPPPPTKLDAITEPAVRAPVEQFATWHHLRRVRRNSTPGQSSEGPKRSAKQEITETIKFLTWLHDTHHRAAATCTQQDVDEYLASGPTTRHSIRTLFIWAKKSRINKAVQIAHREAKTTRTLTQDQRLGWIKELLTGDAESLPYRVAGTLLLLLRPAPSPYRRPTHLSGRDHSDRDADIPWHRTGPSARTLRRRAHSPST